MAFKLKDDSGIVQDYILLLSLGEITMSDVPDLFNLRIMVEKAWDKFVAERDGK